MPVSQEHMREVQPSQPLLSSFNLGGKAFAMIAITKSYTWTRGWLQYFFPTGNEPNARKTYKTRSHLPVNIFVPAGYSAKALTTSLPTLFTVHGGGFTIGDPIDDDRWNRSFADTNEVLVVALNYSKAPFHPFPTAIHDLEALILAILADDSLLIDKTRCAIAGFSAGGNLCLAVAQLEDVKTAFQEHGSPGFQAVIPIYPGLDRTLSRDLKATLRQYKPDLSPKRNGSTDFLHGGGQVFDWSYIPVGQDLKDPLLSPIYAPRDILPPSIFIIACELDMSGHDAWRMACKLAGRPVPSLDEKTGRKECGKTGELELVDERFAWEAGEKGVRWLLIPDVLHGFDHLPKWIQGDETSVRDAEMKDVKVKMEIGNWLKTKVWAQ